MAYVEPAPLWQQVGRLYKQQVLQWRKEFYPALDEATAVAEHLLKTETTVQVLRGGNISVSIVLMDRKESNCATGYFRLRRQLGGVCSVESGTYSDA